MRPPQAPFAKASTIEKVRFAEDAWRVDRLSLLVAPASLDVRRQDPQSPLKGHNK